MKKENTSENRLYARFDYLEYAVLYCPESDEPFRAMIVDIGLGGVQLRSKDPLPIGERITMQIGRDGKEPLEILGHLRYCYENRDTDGGFIGGFKFAPQSHEERVAIAEYVHSVFQRQWDILAS